LLGWASAAHARFGSNADSSVSPLFGKNTEIIAPGSIFVDSHLSELVELECLNDAHPVVLL
jgi:hypothetical protein